MMKEEGKDLAPSRNRNTFSRSVSWTEGPPRNSISKPQWNSKARACLPPLQPLSIIRPSIEEWPKAGSDDLGVWPNPPTPGSKLGSLTPHENLTSEQPPKEFDFRRDMLAFFEKECSRILDHIYLGSDAVAKNREILRKNGITHVLNCVGFVCPEYFKTELVYKTLWLQDCPSEDITSILYDVFDYFEDVREQGKRVLVHCCQGVSRSTSLVIAYLMWKEGQSFDDAFQHVKSARGVTNPNVGFACQLLLCQKRVHALPASPSSVLRMYRMAPHSPYDPLHLVPKMLCEPGEDKLDSRGAFIVHIPSALYIWSGKDCPREMSDSAMTAVSQLVRYERAQGPVSSVKEDEETSEFWEALSHGKGLTVGSDLTPIQDRTCFFPRKLHEYDLDFEIFHRALSGGVVPPFSLSELGSETCLPARENGWNRLRRKFASGVMKEYITSSRLKQRHDRNSAEALKGIEELSLPYSVCNSDSTRDNSEEMGFPCLLPDSSLLQSPSFNLVDPFSSFFISTSPSTSEYSSSFTFSPLSSNTSDVSYVSAQSSPHGFIPRDTSRDGL